MSFRRFFTGIGKFLLAGVLAFIVLTAFSYLYYNIPVHYEAADGATDYKWEPKVFYSRGTEGFAWGRTNNDGYANMFDYNEETEIDVLIMGSSHMEAFQVGMNESTAGRLSEMLADDTVYNIGVSGHTFLNCIGNLEAAIKKYQPEKYVIIETQRISFSDDELMQAVNGTIAELPSHATGLVGLLQKNPYMRLVYKQARPLLTRVAQDDETSENIDSALTEKSYTKNNEQLLNKVLQKINKSVKNGGAQLIIVFHPGTKIEADGTLLLTGDENSQRFQELCESNGIIFLDMGSEFMAEYTENHVLPYGFSNSSVGKGHLNKYGHAMVADELYKLISEVE